MVCEEKVFVCINGGGGVVCVCMCVWVVLCVYVCVCRWCVRKKRGCVRVRIGGT